MVTMISAAAQPGIFPTVFPWVGSSLGSFPLVALAPLAVVGAGMVGLLVLIAKERRARRTSVESRIHARTEPPFSEAA
jgi:hypothetical protein